MAYLSHFVCRFPKLFGSTIGRFTFKKGKWYHRHRQLKSSSTSRKLKTKPWTSPPLSALKTWSVCMLECLIAIEPLSLWLLDQLVILDYLKALVHIVCSPSVVQSILIYRINSYLLSPKFLILLSLNLRARFLLGGGGVVCHIPKFPFRNVNNFPKATQIF
jgi:hypothetical protein